MSKRNGQNTKGTQSEASTNGHTSTRAKRAILYARVSTDDRDNDDRNLIGQIEMGREYADKHNYMIVAELSEDNRGASGASFELPKLGQAIDMAQRGEYDVFICREMDRFARKLAKQLIIEEELKRAGVSIEYVLGEYPDTPEGRLNKNLRATVAEFEREKTRERTRRGLIAKAKAGKWVGAGRTPYGYKRKGKGKDVILLIDETETATVRRIFEMYVGTNGYNEPLPLKRIAAILTREGVPSPMRARTSSKGWYPKTLHTILKRKGYIGEFSYADILINLPDLAIIDGQTFDSAQKRMEKNRKRAKRNRKRDYLLSGFLRCSCGRAMSGHTLVKKRLAYYECCGLSSFRYITKCETKSVRVDVAEPLAWGWFAGLIADEEKLAQGLRDLRERRDGELGTKRDRLATMDRLIEKSERKVKRLAAAFANEDDDTVANALQGELKAAGRNCDALASERDTLAAELAQREVTPEIEADILAKARMLREGIEANQIDYKGKRQLLDRLDFQAKIEYRDGVRGLAMRCELPIGDVWRPIVSPSPTIKRTDTDR